MIKQKLNRDNTLSSRKLRFYNFLLANPVAVLCSINPDSEPHAVTIYVVPDNKLNIYFLTRAGTRKCDNIRHNNLVALASFNSLRQASLQILGRAEEIDDPAQINSLAGKILTISTITSLQKLPPVTKLNSGNYVCFCIHPIQMRMAQFAPPNDQLHELFESIESFDLAA